MKIRDVLQMLNEDGWFLVATRGSHRQFKHPTKQGVLPFQENQMTISHLGHSTAS